MKVWYSSGIYNIRCILDNKMCIGYTNNFSKRKNQHFTQLSKNIHGNIYLQNAYNKHGKENFIFEIIEECIYEELLPSLENYWCNMLNTHNRKYGYNIAPTGPSGRMGNSIETRKKLSEALKGRPSPMEGKKHSQEVIDKIQESRKWYKPSKETKNKMSNSKKGKMPKNIECFKHSALGRKIPSSERIKMSIRQKRPIFQYTKEMIFIKEHLSAIDAAKELGIKHAININKCANNPTNSSTKTAYGYIWRYKDGKIVRGTGPKKHLNE